MKIRLLVPTAVSFFYLLSPSAAEEQPIPLTWGDAVAAAKQNNPELLSSYRAYEASRADYHGSFNGLLPSLLLSNSYSQSDISSEGTWGAEGRASLDLINLSANANIRSSLAAVDRAEAGFRSTSARLRFALRQAFANLLFSQEQVAVARKIEDVRRRNADLVSLKYDSGRESKGNMLRAKAELTSAVADLADAVRNLKVAQQDLNQQMGRNQFSAIVASGTLVTSGMPNSPDFEAAAENHPSVKLAEASLLISEARLKGARSSLWPSLSANYSRTFQGSDYFPGDPHWNASGVLSYPLFGSGPTSTFYQVSSAKRNLEGAREDLRFAKLEARSNLELTWASLAGSLDQIEVQDQFLRAARQRNEEAQVRYSIGLMSFENWEIVVSDLVNFERSTIRAQRDAVVAEANWQLALGQTLEE